MHLLSAIKTLYLGSQRFLLPDLVMETTSGTLILDAKYKDHWEDLSVSRWSELEEAVRNGTEPTFFKYQIGL